MKRKRTQKKPKNMVFDPVVVNAMTQQFKRAFDMARASMKKRKRS